MSKISDRETHKNISEFIHRKRIMAIDFGTVRVGTAVCESMHIAITPKATLQYQLPDFWQQLLDLIKRENVEALVIGVPYLDCNNAEHTIKSEIEQFIEMLATKTSLTIFMQDESYSSKEAMQVMINNGTKKKNRKTKGALDRVAAAIILRSFINDYSS